MAEGAHSSSGGRRVEELSIKASGFRAVIALLKDVAIVLAAIAALLFYLFPQLLKASINKYNLDTAWFFVGLQEELTHKLVGQRLHTGISPLSPDLLLSYTGIMFMNPKYLAEKIETDDDINKTIVGRTEPTAQRGSMIVLVPVSGQCLNVDEIRYGSNYSEPQVWSKAIWYKTIWAHGNLIDCGRGY